MDRIIFVGGAPATGKSYLAGRLSKSLGIPHISTDVIASWMKKVVRKEEYSALFGSEVGMWSDPDVFLSRHTAREVVNLQNEESNDVWKGVIAFLDSVKVWKSDDSWNSFIVEGVAVLPHLFVELMKKNSQIQPIFLHLNNEEKIRKVIYSRGLWDDADKYSDEIKDKEVEWVIEFNEWIKDECKRYSLPIFEVDEREDYFEIILKKVS